MEKWKNVFYRKKGQNKDCVMLLNNIITNTNRNRKNDIHTEKGRNNR